MGLSATVAIGSRNLTNVYLHLREINLDPASDVVEVQVDTYDTEQAWKDNLAILSTERVSIDTAAIRGVAFTSAYALIKAAVSGSTDLNENPAKST
tara:strand:+ start:8122 stop:8409 length:288 start_codon:yes stop_codon:yes gene_type:complete